MDNTQLRNGGVTESGKFHPARKTFRQIYLILSLDRNNPEPINLRYQWVFPSSSSFLIIFPDNPWDWALVWIISTSQETNRRGPRFKKIYKDLLLPPRQPGDSFQFDDYGTADLCMSDILSSRYWRQSWSASSHQICLQKLPPLHVYLQGHHSQIIKPARDQL